MSLVIPDEILQAADLSASELKLEIALLLCQRGRLDLATASQFAERELADLQQQLDARQQAEEDSAPLDLKHLPPNASQAEILRAIDQHRPSFSPADFGLPDTLTLIREDRAR